MNAGKYEIRGVIVNRQTGKQVAEDVPVFLFLGTDQYASYAIGNYAQMCQNDTQRQQCFTIAQAFAAWQTLNPDRVHEPDGRE